MTNKTDFNTDLLAFQIGNAFNTRGTDNHVVAVTEVVDDNHDTLGPGRAGYQRITVGHRDGIKLARSEGIHGGHVIKPFEFNIDADFLEITLFDGYFPGYPSRPIAVTDF